MIKLRDIFELAPFNSPEVWSTNCQCLFLRSVLFCFRFVLLRLHRIWPLHWKFSLATESFDASDHFDFQRLRDTSVYVLFAFPFSSHLSISSHRSTRRWLVRPLVFICISVFWTLPNRNVLYLHLSVSLAALCAIQYCLIQKFLFYFRQLSLSVGSEQKSISIPTDHAIPRKTLLRNDKDKHFFPCFYFLDFVSFLLFLSMWWECLILFVFLLFICTLFTTQHLFFV